MDLDPRSLVIACVLVAVLMGGLSMAFAAVQKEMRLLAAWGAGILLVALGLLGIGLRGEIPDLVSIVVADALVVVGLSVGLRGLRKFVDDPPRDMFAVVMIALLVGLLIFYTEFAPNGNVRMVLVLAGVGTISVRAALLLRRHAKPECARSFRFAEFVFWATGIVAAVRVAGMPFYHTAYVLEVHAANTLPVLFYTAFVVAGTLGVMWMEIELLQAKLMHSARTDVLTGLLNRGGFEQEFDRELSRSSRDGTGFSVVLFDLDHFKRVNDTHGHAAGDALLCAFAGLLADAVRRHDVAARYGGEEFALLMPGVGKDEAIRIADRLRERTAAAPIAAGPALIALTVSGGVATFGADGKDFDALLGSADRALYAAKDAGRNCVLGASARAAG